MSEASHLNQSDADIAAVVRGEAYAAARLISRIERRDASVEPMLARLHALGRSVPVYGITGPPGAGKSTLLDQLIAQIRSQGLRLAVLAIDPSSPFSGGAILADRARMPRHNCDAGVFIRSMASRGCLGGLARAAADALIVLDAMPWDAIVIETVGVGQNEIDNLRHADTVIVVQTPATGDELQAVKSGVIEIGDVFVLNKADLAGAERASRALREAIEFRSHSLPADEWHPPLLPIQAVRGEGVDALWSTMQAHRQHLDRHPEQFERRRRRQVRTQLAERVATLLRQRTDNDEPAIDEIVTDVVQRRCDPMTAARRLLAQGR